MLGLGQQIRGYPIRPGCFVCNDQGFGWAGQSIDAVRPIRDDIEQRVRHLLAELDITPVA